MEIFVLALTVIDTKSRGDWQLSDYDIAFEQIGPIREYVENVLKSYLNNE
jgi:hypothetical protein